MLSIAIVGNCTSLGGCRKRERKREKPRCTRSFTRSWHARPGGGAAGRKIRRSGRARVPAACKLKLLPFPRTASFEQIFLLNHHRDCTAAIMESLSETTWDVIICGTGLQQSLLAL